MTTKEALLKLKKEAKKQYKGLPISCILYNKINGKYYISRNDKITSSRDVYILDKKYKIKSHAEYKAISQAKEDGNILNSEWEIIITTRPCKHCASLIEKENLNIAYFLFDDVFDDWHKIKYYESNDLTHLIKKINKKDVDPNMSNRSFKSIKWNIVNKWKEYKIKK